MQSTRPETAGYLYVGTISSFFRRGYHPSFPIFFVRIQAASLRPDEKSIPKKLSCYGIQTSVFGIREDSKGGPGSPSLAHDFAAEVSHAACCMGWAQSLVCYTFCTRRRRKGAAERTQTLSAAGRKQSTMQSSGDCMVLCFHMRGSGAGPAAAGTVPLSRGAKGIYSPPQRRYPSSFPFLRFTLYSVRHDALQNTIFGRFA